MLFESLYRPFEQRESRLILDGFLTRIMHALSFLSRIPVSDTFFNGVKVDMLAATRVFPVAGLMIALPSAFLLGLLDRAHADPLVSAGLILGIATVITGALHEDGLADTADGFGGGADKERTLTIMKDSRIGSYGAIALILSYLARAAAIAVLIRELPWPASAACLIAVASFSRAMMVWHWHDLPPAREGGIAASIGQPSRTDCNQALFFGTAIACVTLFSSISIIGSIVTLSGASAAAYLFGRQCQKKINGHTGDTIGATQQITEIVMLVALALQA